MTESGKVALRAFQTHNKAIIGLCSIALQHLMNKNYDSAEGTILGIIVALEGVEEE